MKRTLFLVSLAILLTSLVFPSAALADGMVVTDYEEKVYLPSQKAVISWDESSNNEALIISTKMKIGDIADMAWVIPVPSTIKPEVEEGSVEIFYDLARLFEGSERVAPGLGQTGKDNAVEVVEIKEIDIYDIAILKATGAKVLTDWLNDNGFATPDAAVSILQEYCDREDFYFIANKVDLTNKYKDVTVTEDDQTCASEVAGMIPPYSRLSQIESLVEHLISGAANCKGAKLGAVKTLVELDRGIATPLKVSFTPSAPFYPLKISSVNEGTTIVDVYVFSDRPVGDKSGVVTVSKMTENTSSIKEEYGLSQEYITYLSYTGELADLSADSWFEPRDYDHKLDPNYVSLWDRILTTVYYVLGIFLYPAVLLAIFAFALIGFAVVVQAVIRLFKRPKEGKGSS